MEGGSKVYFVSGIDLLQESERLERPYGKTVAFSLELPQLGKVASNVREAVIVNLHNGTNVDHVCAAVRAALSSEADAVFLLQNDLWLKTCLVSKILWIVVVHKFLCSSVVQGLYRFPIACQFSFQRVLLQVRGFEANILLKKAECSHCIQQSHSACMVDCFGWSKTFDKEDLKNVLQEPETLMKLIQGAPHLASSFLNLVPELDVEKPLREAAKGGHEEVVEALLKAGAQVEAKDKDGGTPLHWAAEKGHEKAVGVLLKAGADIEAKDKYGYTPLHLAAEKGHEKMVEVLLKAGADIEAKGRYHGETPLHWAAEKGHEKVVGVLLKAGADIEAKTKDGKNCLPCAAKGGHEKVVEALLKAGADIEAKTPLPCAAKGGHEKVVEALLKAGADIEAKGRDEKTPLHWAAEKGHEKALRWAAFNGHEKVVEVLRKFRARSWARPRDQETVVAAENWVAQPAQHMMCFHFVM